MNDIQNDIIQSLEYQLGGALADYLNERYGIIIVDKSALRNYKGEYIRVFTLSTNSNIEVLIFRGFITITERIPSSYPVLSSNKVLLHVEYGHYHAHELAAEALSRPKNNYQ